MDNRKSKEQKLLEDDAIDLAHRLAIKKIKSGNASSQLITYFLKEGSIKKKLDEEALELEIELLKAKLELCKKELVDASARETTRSDALSAFEEYSSGVVGNGI